VILNFIGLNFTPLVVSYKPEILGFLKNKPEVRKDAMNLLLIVLKDELGGTEDQNGRMDVTTSMFSDLDGRGIFRLECRYVLLI
jgi:hypothetical protein